MCKKIGKLIALLLSITSFFLRAGHVFALEVNYPPLLGKTLNDTSKLGDFVCYLFSFGTAVAFSIAGGTIIVGGVYYLVSYGSSKITNKGKEIIKSGIMGFLLVLASYLIIYTINPDLTKCKVGFLPIPPIFTFFSSSSTKPGIPTTTYKEIPIGTLTENLLTKTINCYGFSETGDPINGDKIKTDDGKDVYGPTFIDHDRADCLLKLTDGAQKNPK